MSLSVCDVCKILDNDLTPKECKFCKLCSAWLCEKDFKSLSRRTLAFLKGKP